MLQRTIYTCEKCGLEIEEDYEKMLNHEYGHICPVMQKPEIGEYLQDAIYPDIIIVKMSNGAKVAYRNLMEMEAPTEKESPSETD